MDPAAIVTSGWRPTQPAPKSVEVLYATAFALFHEERFREAAGIFRAMLKAAPTDERAWLGLGECHERVEQLVLALQLFGAGSIAAQPSARCVLARARVLRKLDRVDDALEALEDATAIASSSCDRELLELIDRERAAAS